MTQSEVDGREPNVAFKMMMPAYKRRGLRGKTSKISNQSNPLDNTRRITSAALTPPCAVQSATSTATCVALFITPRALGASTSPLAHAHTHMLKQDLSLASLPTISIGSSDSTCERSTRGVLGHIVEERGLEVVKLPLLVVLLVLRILDSQKSLRYTLETQVLIHWAAAGKVHVTLKLSNNVSDITLCRPITFPDTIITAT